VHQLLPLTSDRDESVPTFFREFYFDEVQTLLYSNEQHKRGLSAMASAPVLPAAEALPAAAGESGAATVAEPTAAEAGAPAPLTFMEQLWAFLLQKQDQDQQQGGMQEEKDESGAVDENKVVCGAELSEMHLCGPVYSGRIPTGLIVCCELGILFHLAHLSVVIIYTIVRRISPA
jgi:hypothetical protein